MNKKIALIFGITGQDGSYLAEFLLKKKYVVHGVKRRSSSINTARIKNQVRNLEIFFFIMETLQTQLQFQKSLG